MTDPAMTAPARVRNASDDDIDDIAAMYAHYVVHGRASFEVVPPDRAEMGHRFALAREAGLPWLAGEIDGVLGGYAYAAPYRARLAYRYTLEDSVYVAPDVAGRGLGRALLEALIERCATLGYRQMIAVIGDSANAASIGLHHACGFEMVGTMRAIGWKHGRWLDTVRMQRALGPGATTAPDEDAP